MTRKNTKGSKPHLNGSAEDWQGATIALLNDCRDAVVKQMQNASPRTNAEIVVFVIDSHRYHEFVEAVRSNTIHSIEVIAHYPTPPKYVAVLEMADALRTVRRLLTWFPGRIVTGLSRATPGKEKVVVMGQGTGLFLVDNSAFSSATGNGGDGFAFGRWGIGKTRVGN